MLRPAAPARKATAAAISSAAPKRPSYTTRTESVRSFLVEKRGGTAADIRARLDRGVAAGDLPADTDTGELAAFYTTVLYGLSIRARDGAHHDELTSAIDRAMAAWPAPPKD
ncbi:hypothetical protein [Nocardia sp. NPDC051750]|uniref:hypothetical protein n=1 Tax=Nocardia sp. NPDC051750 TaxID=3364325 RepID=UPI0037A2B7A5